MRFWHWVIELDHHNVRAAYSNWERTNEKYVVFFIANALFKSEQQQRLKNPSIEDVLFLFFFQFIMQSLLSNVINIYIRISNIIWIRVYLRASLSFMVIARVKKKASSIFRPTTVSKLNSNHQINTQFLALH